LNFWVFLAFQSLIAAILLYTISRTSEMWDAISRPSKKRKPFSWDKLPAIFVPAAYLFVALFLVLMFNDAIAAGRFDGKMDLALSRMDSYVLMGGSVSAISHYALAHLPIAFVRLLEFVYFEMFALIGATIVLLAMSDGLARALRFVGTIVTAYLIALLIFFLVPATGPYYICQTHSVVWSHGLNLYAAQTECIERLNLLRGNGRPSIFGEDYFIALPCMHLVQPLIVLWFLRKWGRAFWFLVAYDVLMIVSIILLEQHYVVDLIAGVPVALLAIAIVDWHAIKLVGELKPHHHLEREYTENS
jgi:hypothetical protein